jgi:NifU-like protein involved in Fe-S cluster formation
MELEEAREHIKRSARDLSHLGVLVSPTHRGLVRNPFCGDEIEATLSMDDEGKIREVKAQVRGCLVARAAWAMLAPQLEGLNRAEALGVVYQLQSELGSETGDTKFTALPETLTSLLSYRLPSPRHSCATLGSEAVLKALQPEN